MSIKKQAISAVKWTTFSSGFNTVIQIVQLAILARVLDPADFGLMAIVMVFIGFSQMFIDMGVSNAIIYKQQITENQISSLYWLSVFIGVFIFLVIIFVSPFIAAFYGHIELIKLINIVAISFILKPFGHQFMVLLQKDLKFNEIAKTDIVSRLLSFILIIILAILNFGVYSIAIGTIIFSFASNIGYLYYGTYLYKPKLHFSIYELNEFISFGLYQLGEKIINYFSSQFDTFLIGKILGLEVLGVYDIAKNFIMKPYGIINPVVTKVTFPIMSKFNNDLVKLKNVFLKTVSYLSFVNFPIHTMIALYSYGIVTILFGAEWIMASSIIQILAYTYLLRAIMSPAGNLLLSRGKANIAFYWNLITLILYPTSILIGSHWGIVGVAVGTLVLQVLLFYPTWKFIINRISNTSFVEYGKNVLTPFLVTFISALIPFIIHSLYKNNILLTLFSGLIFISVFFLLTKKYNPNIILDFKSLIVKV